MTEVEEIRFGSVGPGGGGFGYNVTTTDAMVAAGQTMTINGSNLVFNDRLMFYASAETDGSFAIVGGGGTDYIFGSQNADTIRGGQGADYIQGNGGADILVYLGAGDSQNNFFDIIVGFDRSMDRFDLPLAVTGFGGEVNQGRLSNATFGSDMAAALNGVLGVGQAALFNPDSGDFAGRHFLVVDDNGIAGYQAGGDLVFEMVNPTAPLGGAMDYFV
jgi:Ca2+-binding RTX toxin-like protein